MKCHYPIGRWLALLAACAATPVIAADKPEPSDDKILFEGPVPGVLVFVPPLAAAPQTFAGDIMFVTKDAVYIRRAGSTSTVSVFDFPRNFLKGITAKKDGKQLEWKWDDARKEVTGYTTPVAQPTIPASVAGQKGERKYVFFALERLQDRVDQAVSQSDPQLLKHLADRAEVMKEHAEKERMDPSLVRLYAEMPEYIERQKQVDKERKEFLDKHMEKVELNRIKDKEAALRAEMTKSTGLGEYFRGAFPRVHIGIGRGWWGRPYAYAGASYDFGGAMAGVATIIRGQQQYELASLRIRFAKELLDKEKQKTLDSLDERQEKMKEARLRSIADVGAALFGLPKSKDSLETRDLAADLQRKNDFRSLLDVLDKRSSTERSGDEQANPFTLLDSYHTMSQLKEKVRADQAKKLFDLALKGIDAVKYVPPGKVYDEDRADVLRSAAALACMAAMLDSPDDSWVKAYSSKAAFAVRVLERAKGYNLDQGGQVREQLTTALALAGRHDEAVRLAGEIKGSRGDSNSFLLTYARLQSIADNTKESLKTLEDAINKGYQDVGFLSKNEDFIAMKRDPTRFNALTKPQVSAFWVVPKAIGKGVQANRFEILNNSPFALTDVRLSMTVELVGGGKKLSFTKVVKSVDPKDKIDWEDVFPQAPAKVFDLKIWIECEQSQAKERVHWTKK
jgi:hypothetical protein